MSLFIKAGHTCKALAFKWILFLMWPFFFPFSQKPLLSDAHGVCVADEDTAEVQNKPFMQSHIFGVLFVTPCRNKTSLCHPLEEGTTMSRPSQNFQHRVIQSQRVTFCKVSKHQPPNFNTVLHFLWVFWSPPQRGSQSWRIKQWTEKKGWLQVIDRSCGYHSNSFLAFHGSPIHHQN